MKKRKAFTIVEVLMVASIGTFLLSLLTMLMIRTIDSHRLIQGHLQNAFVRGDLANILRDDIHTVDEVAVKNDELLLRIDQQSITYSASKDGVSRVAKRGDTIVREDSFYFSKFHSVVFKKSEDLDRAFLVFTVRRRLNPKARVRTAIQIVAQIGKHNMP